MGMEIAKTGVNIARNYKPSPMLPTRLAWVAWHANWRMQTDSERVPIISA